MSSSRAISPTVSYVLTFSSHSLSKLSPNNLKELVSITSNSRATTFTLASSHALVLLEDGQVVGDPMEKTTLEALGWQVSAGSLPFPLSRHSFFDASSSPFPLLSPSFFRRPPPAGDIITPKDDVETLHKAQINVKRRYQFSSALKRMSTVSIISEAGGKKKTTVVSVKGAPETLKTMYSVVPDQYDETYKYFTRRGSRVLALGTKEIKTMTTHEVSRSSLSKRRGRRRSVGRV